MRLSCPVETGSFWSARQRDGHSLHEISYRGCFKPALAAHFIETFSQPDEIVFDPFMGRGTTPLEAALRGRIAAGSDANPLCEMLAEPRLDPPALEEIEAWLEGFDWNQSAETPSELLAFFHPETLQKICALRAAFKGRPLGKPESWIRMVALNRLTGHSSGFFSVLTLPPNQAVTPAAQQALNARHHRIPPPRDVSSIIRKKSRSLLRQPARPDPALARRHRLWTAFAEAPGRLQENSVALVVTSPPFLNVVDYRRDNWLRCWFAGIESTSVPRCTGSLDEWAKNLTVALREMRRILCTGGHVALEVGEIRRGKLHLEETVASCGMVAELEPVKILIHTHPFTKTSRCWGIENNKTGTNTHRVVIFRKA